MKERASFDRFIGKIYMFPPESLLVEVPIKKIYLEGGDELDMLPLIDILKAEGFEKTKEVSG